MRREHFKSRRRQLLRSFRNKKNRDSLQKKQFKISPGRCEIIQCADCKEGNTETIRRELRQRFHLSEQKPWVSRRKPADRQKRFYQKSEKSKKSIWRGHETSWLFSSCGNLCAAA